MHIGLCVSEDCSAFTVIAGEAVPVKIETLGQIYQWFNLPNLPSVIGPGPARTSPGSTNRTTY